MRTRIMQLFFVHDYKSQHIKTLDGLRGLAVMVVLLSHANIAEVFFYEWMNMDGIGKIGVYLFFILSAYLLDRQIANAFWTGSTSLVFWKNYFFRRFIRIYPLYIFTLFLFVGFSYLGLYTCIEDIRDVFYHIFLMGGDGVFWSIPVEFKYYFASPILMWICHRYFKWNLKKVLIFLGGLTITAILVEAIFSLPLISTFRYLPIFLVGTFLAIIEVTKKDILVNRVNKKLYEQCSIGVFIILFITIPFYFKAIFKLPLNVEHSLLYLPYALCWGVVLLATQYGTGGIKKFFELKLLRFLGVISYSLYLFHPLVLKFVNWDYVGIPQRFKMIAFLSLTIVAATISYLIIERPLLKMKIYKKDKVKEEAKKDARLSWIKE